MPYQKALDVATTQDLAAMFVILADDVEVGGADSNTLDDATNDSIDNWQVVQTPAMQSSVLFKRFLEAGRYVLFFIISSV